MNLLQALRLDRRTRAALVGAGGKTTALFQLARAYEPPVVVATSTHLGEWQSQFADRHFIITRPADLDKIAGRIEGVTLLTGPPAGEDRLSGLDSGSMAHLGEFSRQLGMPVFIEADGSRQRPLKAPAAHEPVIPSWVNQVIVLAGLSGLGQPLSEKVVHRPEQFGQLSGLGQGDIIDEDSLVRILVHPEGGLKNVPPDARKTTILNQVDTDALKTSAMRIANTLNSTYNSIIITKLTHRNIRAVVEPTAGIILAAGEARRYGQPKTLLPWQGKALIRHVAEAGLEAGLDPIVVVIGAVGEPLKQALAGLPVTIVENEEWRLGQSTSVRMGLRSLPEDCGAALFLLADQPTVTSAIIEALVRRHQQTLAPIIAPRIAGKRTNPVLFDRDTFPDLMNIEGDTGGRAIFSRYTLQYLDWKDVGLLLDIDSPEDYQKLQGMG